jgi:U5 small nuclear ribonucleoprotein component
VLSEAHQELAETLAELDIYLNASCYQMDVKPLLRLVLTQFFGDVRAFVDCCVKRLPSPVENAHNKIERTYTGPLDGMVAQALLSCDRSGPLVVQIAKLYPTSDCLRFDAFGRILSGTVQAGQRVRVLGESYSADDEEDMTIQEISNVWINSSRYRIDMPSLCAGNWVLLGGVDESIFKTATLVDMKFPAGEDAHVFRPLRYTTIPVFKVAVEPLNPTELPKMMDGLRKINKSYPIVQTKVEESGEHIIVGTGEMYLDCVMHDLRTLYADIEVRVSDPVVKFCETVVETSSLKCFAETPNKKYALIITY